MKQSRIVIPAAVIIAAASGAAWRVSAQEPMSAVSGPVAQWQYPGADVTSKVNWDNARTFPFQGVQTKTTDRIEKVYAYYRKKIDAGYTANESNSWLKSRQSAFLTTLLPGGGQSSALLDTPRHEADSALLIIHQPQQTITVELSRDPQDKSTTDILLVADSR